ncbi:MAG: hypothetical protein RID09_11005 [Coleofasciculus sp. G1-WW12-02]|uniref:hypothetical protein n=1 Tax=Coleofasciculus sp. G1-WW12-02 TaxID=3068483 RepID=UPI0032F90158
MLRDNGENGKNLLVNDFRYKDRDFILIDESHNLRNPSTQRYKVVETFLATGKQDKRLSAVIFNFR